jgi:hypothetical protein
MLPDILRKCCDHMLANMDLENVLEVLALADTFGEVVLKIQAMDFICANFQVKFVNFVDIKDLYLYRNKFSYVEVLDNTCKRQCFVCIAYPLASLSFFWRLGFSLRIPILDVLLTNPKA